jgi:hypothetical protein
MTTVRALLVELEQGTQRVLERARPGSLRGQRRRNPFFQLSPALIKDVKGHL